MAFGISEPLISAIFTYPSVKTVLHREACVLQIHLAFSLDCMISAFQAGCIKLDHFVL
jgi:hypothetical protein